MKLGILAYHDKTHLSDKGYNSEIDIFLVMPLFNLEFLSKLLIKWIYLKTTEGINTRLGILIYHNKTHLLGKGHYSENYIFGVMPLFNLDFFGQNCQLSGLI